LTVADDDVGARRRIDALVMAAEILDLASLRPDLAELQRTELYFAAVYRFRDLPGGEASLAGRDEIYAWIDLVMPPAPGTPIKNDSSLPRAVRSILEGDPSRLLLGPEPAVTAAPLAALARRRPDLSAVQRHELLVGARRRLARPGFGRKVEASPNAIFAWIDVVVPVRTRPMAGAGKRNLGRPKGSRRPSVDDLEDQVHDLRQGLRVRDQREALEAELALESMVSTHPETNHSEPVGEPPRSHLVRTAKPGPSPMLTREQVEHAGQDLASRGLPAGERSIALELGVSRDAVRYALGKDQRRRPQS
jgi:hypothetical protein